jgi:hypothetical protein
VNYSKFSQVQAENGALIATCNRLDTLVNLQANAHLIAAAPEMYEALELIYGRLLMSDRDGESRITAEDGKMAELALKKARGEL